jgi:succinyl-CoA synthetase beta subunit
MEIEEVAAKHPEKIIKVAIDPTTGYMPFHGRKLALALGLTPEQTKEGVGFFGGIYKCFIESDMFPRRNSIHSSHQTGKLGGT